METRDAPEALTDLRQGFFVAWQQLGARKIPDFAEILARYREPHRAYHTLEHLLECHGWLTEARALAERPFEVELALAYHDLVYDPFRSDNEQRSAASFRRDAEAAELGAEQTERICALIEGTATHCSQGTDGALLNDIDLAILGAPPARYDSYEAQVRSEYAQVEDHLFRAGRARILRSFLDRAALYATPFFKERLETQARSNLQRSLAALEAAMHGG